MSAPNPDRISTLVRWLRFNLVGLLGILVQLAVLGALTHLGTPYLLSTALAVETAVVHNWTWHERYTWSDRSTGGLCPRMLRLIKFNFSNGAVSLIGNLFLMNLLVGHLHSPVLIANLIAVTACSLVNFLLGDCFVFHESGSRSCL